MLSTLFPFQSTGVINLSTKAIEIEIYYFYLSSLFSILKSILGNYINY